MKTYVLKRRLDLSEMGPEWKDCYIEMREPVIEEVQRLATGKDADGFEEMMSLLDKCFISGMAYDGSSVVEIKKEDLKSLPISIVKRVGDFFGSVLEMQETTS